jgi:hypothetical protein
MRAVVPTKATTMGNSNVMSTHEEYQLFAPRHERIVSSVLENRGGADEHEYVGREPFSNHYEDPSNTFMGTRVIYANRLDRPTEIVARTGHHTLDTSTPGGYTVGKVVS